MSAENQTSRFQRPLKQWIKCSVWSLIYILFIMWVGNYWWLFGLPVVFDLFITGFIPWTWWKKTKNKTLLSVFGWVDAIVFALVAVYFINTYLFQNYQIPSSSLEKSLLVGDFLFVSKASYGPRIPNTPLSFPLVQHTFPLLNCKSFIEHPQWDYHRLKGFDTVKRNDIVVFNFPAGDTVAVKMQNPDYYSICYSVGLDYLKQQNPAVVPATEQCYSIGRELVRSKNSDYGDIVYRPVDRRENYVKRCIAIGGDWMQIKNNQVYVNGQKQEKIPGIQFNYFVQTDGTLLNADVLEKLGISKDDIQLYNGGQYVEEFASIGLDSKLPIYHFPLNEEAFNKLQKTTGVTKIQIETANRPGDVFPLGGHKSWTRDNYGPIWVPKKGSTLALNSYNLPIYERIIRVYEHNKLEVKNHEFYINDKPTKTYTFKMDYFWMMGDNRHNSADSRYWGFVPEDHVVGRPVMVWLSLDKDKGWFDGKIRFSRFFKNAEK
ncbi:MAG: S26 family signal peptidase [Bacteroidota bacterium]|nr:S26 family signal peptidase [Bacteroidota bacterium]